VGFSRGAHFKLTVALYRLQHEYLAPELRTQSG
jgi:hypothetical protein